MVAILVPSPDHDEYRHGEAAPHRPAPRAGLTLIEGGRSPQRLAATYRRRRLLAGVVAALLLFAGFGVARAAVRAVTPQALPAATAQPGGRTVVVQPGDSYWSIARRLQPNGDVRSLVDQLSAEHADSALQPGDVLAVPH